MSIIMTHPSCNCDDIDVDTTYCMFGISVGNSPSFSTATLFNTGAHTSFVIRKVAAWIELQAKGDSVSIVDIQVHYKVVWFLT